MKCSYLRVSCALLLAACSPSEMQHKAEADFAAQYGCPRNLLNVKSMDADSSGTDKFDVNGCGKWARYYCDSTRCASLQITIATRHAREFACEPETVKVDYLDGGAWKASGCGHDTTYQCETSLEFVVRCFAETADRENQHVAAAGNQ